jgi:hypothetical protein
MHVNLLALAQMKAVPMSIMRVMDTTYILAAQVVEA